MSEPNLKSMMKVQALKFYARCSSTYETQESALNAVRL